ncbi:MAG: hypothetical protein CFE23_16045 [Flavobacterium sp. BFFFF1]|nr:MAG: hypothetical protein CFE23_16045 [Flavobacterium sp. BFFFF1]
MQKNNIIINKEGCFFMTRILKWQLTSGGFTLVAAFGTEYSRLDKTKLWKKMVHFTRKAAIA